MPGGTLYGRPVWAEIVSMTFAAPIDVDELLAYDAGATDALREIPEYRGRWVFIDEERRKVRGFALWASRDALARNADRVTHAAELSGPFLGQEVDVAIEVVELLDGPHPPG